MCPVVLLALISSLILFLLEVTAALSVTFWPSIVSQLKEDQSVWVSLKVNTSLNRFNPTQYEYYIDDNTIVDVVGELAKVPTDDVVPMAHPLVGQHQRLRADAVSESDHHDKYQANAPAVQSGLYVVPKVIE